MLTDTSHTRGPGLSRACGARGAFLHPTQLNCCVSSGLRRVPEETLVFGRRVLVLVGESCYLFFSRVSSDIRQVDLHLFVNQGWVPVSHPRSC